MLKLNRKENNTNTKEISILGLLSAPGRYNLTEMKTKSVQKEKHFRAIKCPW